MTMTITEKDIQNIYTVLNHYCKRVEELEAQLARLQGKKECVIIEMKPNNNILWTSKTPSSSLAIE